MFSFTNNNIYIINLYEGMFAKTLIKKRGTFFVCYDIIDKVRHHFRI